MLSSVSVVGRITTPHNVPVPILSSCPNVACGPRGFAGAVRVWMGNVARDLGGPHVITETLQKGGRRVSIREGHVLVAAEDRVTWATARSAGIPRSWGWPGNGLSPVSPRGT